ncbi:MAG: DUF4175 family protein, partial [Pseudomonadota bacterium]
MTMEMWATPPDYTGVAPRYFAEESDRIAELTFPTGTELSIRLFDAPSAPNLSQTSAPGFVAPEPAPTDEDAPVAATAQSWSRTLTLTQDGEVSVSLEGEEEPLIALDLTVIPDRAPLVSLGEPPTRGAQGVTKFSYLSSDDYGVARAWAVIALDPEGRETASSAQEPFEIELPLPVLTRNEDGEIENVLAPTEVEESFAGHPWIGLPVTMVLHVEDDAGQMAQSEPHRFELFGRRFSEPMAKAIIEQRSNFSWNEEAAPRVRRVLSALTRFPDNYFSDAGAYLSVRTAISRLAYAIDEERVLSEKPSILERLYEAALRLEDGDLENAAERLARAQRQLREAIENGASPEEIAELTEELREAVENYMRALAALAENNPEMAAQDGESQTISQDQIEELIRAIEEAMEAGDLERAAELQAMLQELLENMRPGNRTQTAGEGQEGEEGEQADNPLDPLNDM